jgi:hypothetical protein
LEPSIHAVQKISTKLNKQYQVGQDAWAECRLTGAGN